VKYRTLSVCVAVVALSGCAAPGMNDEISHGKATLIPTTVNASRFGANYQISGVVEAGQQRTTVDAFATDCQMGFGTISNLDSSNYVHLENVMVSGTKPADKLFATMCRLGLPIANRMDAQLSDRQRADGVRSAQHAIATLNAIDATQRAQRIQDNHDDAIRDAGKQVSDAIKQQGNKSVTCTSTGAGYVCN
jgi:hypothetical protein